MTTERVSIHRKRPIDWPLFASINLPDDIGVVLVENRRQATEHMTAAVGSASDVLRAGLLRTGVADQVALWLLVVGQPFPVPTTPLRRRLLERSPGLWAGLEEEDDPTRVALPRGQRSEVRVTWSEETLGRAGSIRFGLDELPVALEVVRQRFAYHAVVVATDPAAADPLPMLLPPTPPPNPRSAFPLYVWAVGGVVDRTFAFVARATGEFDDYKVGCDLVARTKLLDPLEAALRQVLVDAGDGVPDEPDDPPPPGRHFTTWDGGRYDY